MSNKKRKVEKNLKSTRKKECKAKITSTHKFAITSKDDPRLNENINKTLKNKIVSSLRRLSFYHHKPIQNVRKRTKIDASLYKCEECGKYQYSGSSKSNLDKFRKKYGKHNVLEGKIEVDHTVPVVNVENPGNWDDFIKRLFCGEDNLRGLCTKCHKSKSILEEKNRRKP